MVSCSALILFQPPNTEWYVRAVWESGGVSHPPPTRLLIVLHLGHPPPIVIIFVHQSGSPVERLVGHFCVHVSHVVRGMAQERFASLFVYAGRGTMLKSEYAPDHKVYGYVHADDVYTPEERICNYIEAFHDYPSQYKGERDYKMLRWMAQMRKDGHEIPIRFVGGVAKPPVSWAVLLQMRFASMDF